MDKNYARQLVKETFENHFDKDRFTFFIKNLLNNIDESKSFHAHGYIQEKYKQTTGIIKTYERIGTYIDPEENKIDILIVYLQKEDSIDRARTSLRNFAADYLKNRGEKDAGLIAFVSPNGKDWRFSFVKMEYKLAETPSGRIKAKEEFTPARRYSYLVGEGESSHTAQSRLVSIIQDDVSNPSLKQIEEAFNIEKVTKEFFEKYRELFLWTKETLDGFVKKDPLIRNDFEEKQVNTVDFAKKLLGQIVFLYFLQKKGWFGVEKNNSWGTGSKRFLRDLFDGKIIRYENYFNDVLEPLFYDALARDKSDVDHFNPLFNCKIPFLNGGLFDPISNYDWVNTDIKLLNELFSNDHKTKEGDIGTGILDIFDRYNFTVKEDEPLEKEVAVDPEMLGKVFENLLEVKDRKSKGTYYTPREIVHYMCQESLINYLVNECEGKVNRKDIETLIQYGETAVEHDSRVEQEGKETETYSYKLPESIRKNAQLLDDKLKIIRVCDPAIGSGAFPVGMMNEIIRTRNTLTNYLEDKKDRSIYNFKRDAIQNSLYGVDIDPGAVEIAKLRLWLSLVVDEQDIKQIKPLPNLDYKIMQGNSLLEEFEGVKLFDDKLLNADVPVNNDEINKLGVREKEIQKNLMPYYQKNPLWMKNKKLERPTELYQLEGELKRVQLAIKDERTLKFRIKDSSQSALFDNEQKARKIWEALQSLQREFFGATQKTRKDHLRKQIEKLEWELIEATLNEQDKTSSLQKLEQYKISNIKPFFLWKLNFSEVFQEKGGFDIVIGNPPYGFRNVLTPEEKTYFRKIEKIEFSSGDSAELFCKKSFDNLVKKDGILTFIIPKKSLYGDAWEGFRRNYWLKNNLQFLLDSSKAFDNVLLEANAFGLIKNSINSDVDCLYLDKNNNIIKIGQGDKDAIFLENSTAQVYLLKIPKTLWNKIHSKKINEGLVAGKLGLAIGTDFFSDSETDYKLLKGIDIGRWKIKSCRWLKNKQKLNWQSAEEFLNPKIIAQRLVAHIENPSPHIKITACYDREGIIISNTLMSFVLNEKIYPEFWLAYLNSSFVSWYAYNFIYARAIRGMDLYNFYIQQLPIPRTILEQGVQDEFSTVVKLIEGVILSPDFKINYEKQAKVKDYEKQIDQLVYKLYGLTPEEIAVVEDKEN